MLYHPNRVERLTALVDRLRVADRVTADMIAAILAEMPERPATASLRSKTAPFTKTIEAGAWNDAALALMQAALPRWQLRRLAYDESEWHCALSQQRELPDWLDGAIETSHPDLTLAMLKALVKAMRYDVTKNLVMQNSAVQNLAPHRANRAFG
jgi:hypothetical protein